MSALLVQGLRRRYGSREVLRGVDLDVAPGDVYGFLGPNGAGKTTAIRCILGLIPNDGGEISIFGERDPVRRRRHVGALVETPCFHEWLSGRKNLEIACDYGGLDRGEVDDALVRVGLGGRGDDPVRTYSLGMKQRLGIARAMLGSPKLLILDEPTNGLDPRGMRDVRELIRALASRDGLTVLVSSHLLYEIEEIASRVGILRDGRLVAEGDVPELIGGAGPARVFELQSPDVPTLQRALEGIPGAAIQEARPGGLLVSCGELEPDSLNRALIQAGADVSALIPRSRSLEDLFLSLIGDGAID